MLHETQDRLLEFFISGRLPGLNEMIDAAKKGRGMCNAYAREKKQITGAIAELLQPLNLPRFKRCRIGFRWVEPDRRRDIDNISAGKKYILDALVWQGVIDNDDWKHVKGFLPEEFDCDKINPGVWVRIEAA